MYIIFGKKKKLEKQESRAYPKSMLRLNARHIGRKAMALPFSRRF